MVPIFSDHRTHHPKDFDPLNPRPDLGVEAFNHKRGLDAFFCTRLFQKT
jgi:hypothetical protein